VHVSSGNSALPIAFERLNVHLQMFRLYYGSGIGMEAVREHHAIYRAIADRDEAAAADAMAAHLAESRNRLLPALTSGGRFAQLAPARLESTPA
jgi:DNA-binding GntR family transcriptional regulator